MTIPPFLRPPQPEQLPTTRTPIERKDTPLLTGTAIGHHDDLLSIGTLQLGQNLDPQRIATAMLHAHARLLTLFSHPTTSPARQVVTACSIVEMENQRVPMVKPILPTRHLCVASLVLIDTGTIWKAALIAQGQGLPGLAGRAERAFVPEEGQCIHRVNAVLYPIIVE